MRRYCVTLATATTSASANAASAHQPYAGMPLLLRLCLLAARRLARLALRLLLMVLMESYYQQRHPYQVSALRFIRCYKLLSMLAEIYNLWYVLPEFWRGYT